MVIVLDASALMAYLEKEPGYEKVKNLLARAAESERNLLMSAVNWGEVFYVLVKNYGQQEAEKITNLIETFPIEVIDADIELVRQAALYKAIRKLPYVDSFAAALTKFHKGELVTGDKEFRLVEPEIRITWL
jgi:ribonuclease VapC